MFGNKLQLDKPKMNDQDYEGKVINYEPPEEITYNLPKEHIEKRVYQMKDRAYQIESKFALLISSQLIPTINQSNLHVPFEVMLKGVLDYISPLIKETKLLLINIEDRFFNPTPTYKQELPNGSFEPPCSYNLETLYLIAQLELKFEMIEERLNDWRPANFGANLQTNFFGNIW